MVDAVSSTSGASIFQTKQTTEERLEDERDQFLTLFLTQLQNQDPTSPMDTNEMTNQLVQFTAVEQQIETNKSLASLVSAQAANSNASAVNYIGEHVVFNGNNTNLTDAGASWGYMLPSEANATTINVFNAAKQLVYSEAGQTAPGERFEFNWDGTDADGEKLPNGPYSIQINALDADNDGIAAEVEAVGLVTGVVTGEDGPSLMVGKIIVEMNEVTRVSAT
ncbi:flagellar hook capping FlgD N-terminal domain-containing protein [Nisaea sp.]|uniref:flagellar hook assembly protein FlgD n=1 Tax=Nisaea sp. TaxID=2024842 RepID=UPI0032EB3036